MIASVATSQIWHQKKKNTTTLIKTGGRVPGEGGAGNASQRQLRSVSLSLSLSPSLCICLQQHTRLQSQPQLSLPLRTHARTRFGNPPLLHSLALFFSLSSLSCAVFSYAQQHQQEVSIPCPVRIPLLLQYRCSSAFEVHSIFYQQERARRFFLFCLPSSSSSSCFTLEFCLLQVTYTRCRFSFFLLTLLQVTVVIGCQCPSERETGGPVLCIPRPTLSFFFPVALSCVKERHHGIHLSLPVLLLLLLLLLVLFYVCILSSLTRFFLQYRCCCSGVVLWLFCCASCFAVTNTLQNTWEYSRITVSLHVPRVFVFFCSSFSVLWERSSVCRLAGGRRSNGEENMELTAAFRFLSVVLFGSPRYWQVQ